MSAPAARTASQESVDWTRLLLGFGGMVIGQFMAILDIQIVAASLPQIQAGVGASADEISWVQTAYLIPEVVMIPLSAFLSRMWGTRALFMLSCAGFLAMSVLEEGARENWLADPLIASLSALALVSGALFVRRSLTIETPIVELHALGNRNFLTGVVMTFVVGAALFGGTFLLPLFLGRVRDFSSAEVGTTMVVSGLAMFVSGPIAGRIMGAVDLRIPMAVGFALCAWSMWLATDLTTDWGFWQFAGVQAIRGVGVMLGMIAAQQVTMSTLPAHMVKNASGLVNLARNVGGAFGLAVLNTTVTQQSARHLDTLSAAVSASDVEAQSMIAGLTARMEELGVAEPHTAALSTYLRLLERQAQTQAFADAFALLAIACGIAAALALTPKPLRLSAGGQIEGAH